MGTPITAGGPTRSLKVPVVIRDEYIIKFERSNGLTFGHCDVFAPWSKDVKYSLMADFDTLRRLHREPIHGVHIIGDKKHLKFLAMFGLHHAPALDDLIGTGKAIYKTKEI